MVRSHNGPMVMEVNSSPGLEGIENATKKDIASIIVTYIEKNVTPGSKHTRAKG